jgi:hypothetical protein
MDFVTIGGVIVSAALLLWPVMAAWWPRLKARDADLIDDLRVVRRVGEAMAAKGSVEGVRAANALIEAALAIPMPTPLPEQVRS